MLPRAILLPQAARLSPTLPNLLIVLSGPSGVGKGTLVQRYLETHPQTFLSISATTRLPRSCEQDGVHYCFLDTDRFQEMRKRGELLEWAEVFGDLYGSPRRPVEEALAEGRDVILEIDVQGGLKVRQAIPEAVLLFVLPPTFEELSRRLCARRTESPERIEFRLQTARLELQALPQYDYLLVNDRLEEAVAAIASIVEAERRRISRIVPRQEGDWLK
ncbi:MAG: guanylate kinase [bacterium]